MTVAKWQQVQRSRKQVAASTSVACTKGLTRTSDDAPLLAILSGCSCGGRSIRALAAGGRHEAYLVLLLARPSDSKMEDTIRLHSCTHGSYVDSSKGRKQGGCISAVFHLDNSFRNYLDIE